MSAGWARQSSRLVGSLRPGLTAISARAARLLGSNEATVLLRSRWWNSVRVRLLLGLVVVVTLGLAAAGATTYVLQRSRELSDIDTQLSARVVAARHVVLGASNSKPTGPGASATLPLAFTSGSSALSAVIGRVLPQSHESSLGIVDGKAAFAPGIATDFQLQTFPGFVHLMTTVAGNDKPHLGTFLSARGPIRYIAAPVRVSGSSDRAIYVAAIDINGDLSTLNGAFLTFWELYALTVIVVASLGWLIAGRLLRPIHTLSLAASRVTSTHRKERIPVDGVDDLAMLTHTVNSMLDRLDQAMTDQRQLVDDVRHELHTPITIVRGHLEVVDPGDPADVAGTRDLAIEELDRVTDLIEDLALLAETEREAADLVSVDIADFTARVFEKLSVLPNHAWTLEECANVRALIDAPRLTQAWLQLADNAGKYSPHGLPIEIGSHAEGPNVALWIRDHGDGIDEAARERIFERFGRVNTGRGIAGSGLGLSIVQSIAAAHRGTVSFESSSEGTTFTILIPLAEVSAPVLQDS